jgi:decaprenyl-phosphate phosphoribosyltransferase
VRDIEQDRAHPTKRFRAIASGEIGAATALVTSALLMVSACALGSVLGWAFLAVIATYCVLNTAYCLGLKNEPVIDIAIIASSFLLRAVGGGVACGIELSQWFLLIAAFGSLFMAAGKRYAEVRLVGEGEAATRRSLGAYSASYLRFVWSAAAGMLIMSYALWSFDLAAAGSGEVPWATISMVPFILAVLRYAIDVDAGRAGEPEEIVLRDRKLQLIGLAWLVATALAIYSG